MTCAQGHGGLEGYEVHVDPTPTTGNAGIQHYRTDADPCPQCHKGATCRTTSCGRLKLPINHPYRTAPMKLTVGYSDLVSDDSLTSFKRHEASRRRTTEIERARQSAPHYRVAGAPGLADLLDLLVNEIELLQDEVVKQVAGSKVVFDREVVDRAKVTRR